MKRSIPVAIAIAVGLFVLLDSFITNRYIDSLGYFFLDSAIIIAAFAIVLGFFNITSAHLKKVKTRHKDWPYSIILLIVMWVVVVLGLASGQGPLNPVVHWIFQYVQLPIQATIASLLAFFVAAAAYRTFRMRNLESVVLLVVALIVLLGQVPLGRLMWDQLPVIKEWLLEVPSLAGARGILLGVALGTVATGLRVLLGIDRPYSE